MSALAWKVAADMIRGMQVAGCVLLLGGLASTAGAMDAVDIDPQRVSVGGFSIVPMGNLVHAHDCGELHPKAMLGAGWNSNVHGTESDPVDDYYLRSLAGLEYLFRPAQDHLLVANVEIDRRDQLKEDDRDLTGGIASLRWLREGPRLSTDLRAGYGINDDPLLETGEPVTNDEAIVAGSASWLGAVSRTTVSFNAKRVDYTEDSRFFDKDQRDYQRYGPVFEFARLRAVDSDLFVRVRVDRIDYDVQERYADSLGVNASAGFRNRFGTRSSIEMSAGVDHRRYEAAVGKEARAITRPAADATLTWSWKAGSELSASAFSGIQDAVAGSGSWMYGGSVEVRYRLLLNTLVRAQVGYTRILGDDRIPGGVDQDRQVRYGEIGSAYFFGDGLAIRALVAYAESDSDIGQDYDRVRALTELGFVF